MPLAVGGGRTASSLMCVLFSLAVVLLLTVGVAAIPEEHKPAQEQPPEEVHSSTSLFPVNIFIVIGRMDWF